MIIKNLKKYFTFEVQVGRDITRHTERMRINAIVRTDFYVINRPIWYFISLTLPADAAAFVFFYHATLCVCAVPVVGRCPSHLCIVSKLLKISSQAFPTWKPCHSSFLIPPKLQNLRGSLDEDAKYTGYEKFALLAQCLVISWKRCKGRSYHGTLVGSCCFNRIINMT